MKEHNTGKSLQRLSFSSPAGIFDAQSHVRKSAADKARGPRGKQGDSPCVLKSIAL